MKRREFHKKHVNKWLVLAVCLVFVVQLVVMQPILAVAEDADETPTPEATVNGEIQPEVPDSSTGGALDDTGGNTAPETDPDENPPAEPESTTEPDPEPESTETTDAAQPRNIKDVYAQAGQGTAAYQDESARTILSGMELSFLSKDGQTTLANDSVTEDAAIRFGFSVSIPADIAGLLSPGDYYSFQLPESIKAAESTELLDNGTGAALGNVAVSADGSVKITLGDGFSPYAGEIKARFSVNATWNTELVAAGTPFDIRIDGEPNIAAVTVTIPAAANTAARESTTMGAISPMAAPIGTDIKTYFTTTPASIVTGMNLTYTDAQGNPMPDGTANINSQINFNFGLAIPNGVTSKIKAGDFYQITLPPNVKIKTGFYNQPMVDPLSKKTYATFSVDVDGTVTITFTDAVSSLRDVTGTLDFTGAFNSSVIGNPGDTNISIPSETNVTSSVTLKPLVGSAIEKKGAFDKTRNPGSITWDVIINKNMETLTNAQVVDTFPTALDYAMTTVQVLPVTMDVYGNVVSYGTPLSSGYTVSNTTTPNDTVTFDTPINTAYCIRYTTPIDTSSIAALGEVKNFPNTATLDWSGNSGSPLSAQASLTATYDSYLKKSATGYNPSTQTVNWTIRYNYAGGTIPANTTIEDIYNDPANPIDMTFDDTTLQIYPVTFDSKGNPVQGTPALTNLDYRINDVAPGETFEIEFLRQQTGAFNIVYQTHAAQSVGNLVDGNLPITNVVEGTPPGGGPAQPVVSTGTVTLRPQGVIKTVKNVDYSSPAGGKTIEWQIVLNNDHKDISSGVLTDNINYIVYEQITEFQVVDKGADGRGNTVLANNTGNYTLDTSLPSGFILTLGPNLFANGGTTNHSFTVTFKTPLRYNVQPAGLTSYVNQASFQDNYGIYNTDARVPLNKQTQKNGSKSGSYNAVTKQITWSVYTNYAETGLQNAYISDPILAGQTYVPDSTRIYFYEVGGSGGYTKLRELTPLEYGYFMISEPDPSATDQVLNVHLPDALEGALDGVPIASSEYPPLFLIEFETSVDGTVVQKTYTNEASFYNDNTPLEKLDSSVTVNNGGSLALKDGSQGADGYAYWNVTINPSQSTLSSPKVVDVPSSNQSIVTSSLTINGMTVAENGTLTPDLNTTLISGTDYDATYTKINGIWTLTVTFKGQYATIDSAYYMSYKASIYVDPSGGATQQITNKATITGNNGGTQTGTIDTPLSVDVNRGGGTLRGTFQSLTIQKTDMAGAALAGAQFQLYDQNGDPVGGITTSDAQGVITYDNLVSGNYTIQEVAPAPGYTITTALAAGVPVNLSADNNTFTFMNGPSQVEFVKENQIGYPVPGATFDIEQQTATGWEKARQGLVTDSAGQILVDGLSAGHYQFVETKRAADYLLNTIPMEFDVTASPDVISVGSFIDYQGSFQMVKESDAGEPLEGVVFELHKTDRTPSFWAELTTDANGMIALAGLPPGSYKLVETRTLDGLILDDRPIYFSIAESYAGEPPTVDLLKFVNHLYKGNLEVTKTDLEGKPLAGAEFSVYDSDDNHILGSITTNSAGKAVITGLLPGEYYFVETAAPAGYVLDDTKHPLSVVYDAQGQHISVEQAITNTPIPPTPTVPATGSSTGDDSDLSLWITLCLVAGVSITGILVFRSRKKRRSRETE